MSSRYLPHGAFFQDLHRSVDGYFASAGLSPRGSSRLWVKTGIILAWCALSWIALVFLANTWWQALLSAVSLGLAVAGIGFNIMHDGGHRAFSERDGVNRAMALMLDVIGGSSYVWHWKHNVHHHANPNVAGLDADIDIQPFVRLSPEQPWRPWYRYQHLYTWALYSFLTAKWHLVDDFRDVLTGHIDTQRFPRPKDRDLAAFISGKLLFFSWAFVVPALFHPVWKVALGYLFVSVVVSLVMALTFQGAHCVTGAAFPGEGAKKLEWAEHQARTSLDFAPGHRLWTWYLGGLNYQLEHHLFPRVSHVHYPALAPLVREVCAAHGVPYQVMPSVGATLVSHGRWLLEMGRKPLAP
ncbi:MAG: acyl-CoA desaturase [Myxococcota bacterium]